MLPDISVHVATNLVKVLWPFVTVYSMLSFANRAGNPTKNHTA